MALLFFVERLLSGGCKQKNLWKFNSVLSNNHSLVLEFVMN